ncbi:oligosaccharide flippase family protein [Caproiciproducens sp. MSJ-32]|uniref:oligosaccharide flippase family protein n=1 Tax=Caproiciproducens sp. MSJ-32 TaxID=2841527 RepID=UPI001C10E84E|nr:oligosaccharide flippase family protein [Caproiciproducens sp. MSJ-32]MBU5456158.1 oligosaccharide flippase family protein [Caproiciproducens sp. MSJ-32]
MNRLVKKFIEFSIGNGIVLLLGFISSPIITRIISPEEYGKASMFTTFTSLIVLIATMGMDQAYIRYFNDEEEENRGGLLGKSIGITFILNLIIGVVILLCYKQASIFIIDEQSFFLIILVLIHNIFSTVGNFSLIHVRMKQRGKAYSLITVINKLSYLIFIGLFYFVFKDHYLTIVIATILSNIVRMLWSIYIEKYDWKNVKRVNEVKTSSRELIYYGIPFIFSMAITWLFQSIDKVSLRIYSTYTEIGLYSGAMTIIGLLNNCQAAFTTFWTPVAYEKYSNNPEDTKFFTNANQIVSVAMIIISIWIIAAKDLIVKLLGSEYEGAQFIFPFLVMMPIMYTISETTVLGINFMKKTKYHIYIATFSALSNIIGNLLLVPKYGATGAAISTGLAYVVFFITRTYYSRKFYNVKFYMIRFWISIALVYILAAYSSLYKFDYIILLLTIFSTIAVIFLYREIIMKSLTIALRKRK